MAYNTVPFHGKVCRVEKNNVAMEYGDGWTINMSVEIAKFIRSGQHWTGKLPGFADWNGSFGGQVVLGNTEQKAFFDNLIAATPSTQLTDVKFLLDGSTNAITGNIYLSGLAITGQAAGVVTFQVQFEGDMAMSVTDAA